MKRLRVIALLLAASLAASGNVTYCHVRSISDFDLLVTIPLLSGIGAILSSLGFDSAGNALQQKATDIVLGSICQDGVAAPPQSSKPVGSARESSARAITSIPALAYITDSG